VNEAIDSLENLMVIADRRGDVDVVRLPGAADGPKRTTAP